MNTRDLPASRAGSTHALQFSMISRVREQSVLSQGAWVRVAALLVVLALLWFAVAWAVVVP